MSRATHVVKIVFVGSGIRIWMQLRVDQLCRGQAKKSQLDAASIGVTLIPNRFVYLFDALSDVWPGEVFES